MPGFGFATTATVDDELGIWTALPTAVPRDFALESAGAVTAGPGLDASLWEVSLPDERRASGALLRLAGARLAVAQASLPYASQRLATFLATGGVPVPIPGAGEAPEEALAGWIATSQYGQEPPGQQGPVEQVTGFFGRVRDTLRNYAAIDTNIGGRRAGLTVVSWTGDFSTAWARGLTAAEAAQHTAAISLTLRTRDAWLRLALTVVQGALQIASSFAANPALALPAAYRFVRQVIDQVQALGGLPALAQTSL